MINSPLHNFGSMAFFCSSVPNSTTYPLSSSSICLTNVFGTLLAKKSRADFHNISCSSVNDRSIFVSFPSNLLLGCRLWLSGQSQGTGCGISGYLSGAGGNGVANGAQIEVLHPPSESGPLVLNRIGLPPVAPDGAQLAVEPHDLHAHLSPALSGNTAKYLDMVGGANHIPTGKR